METDSYSGRRPRIDEWRRKHWGLGSEIVVAKWGNGIHHARRQAGNAA